jgi:hypothetical protein
MNTLLFFRCPENHWYNQIKQIYEDQTGMGESRNACRVLVVKTEGNRSVGSPGPRRIIKG